MRAKTYNHSSLWICECFIDTAPELNVPFLYLFHTKTASSHQKLLLECPSALDTHENSWCSNWLELETFGAISSWTTQQQPHNLFTDWWTLSSTFLYPFEVNSSFVWKWTAADFWICHTTHLASKFHVCFQKQAEGQYNCTVMHSFHSILNYFNACNNRCLSHPMNVCK